MERVSIEGLEASTDGRSRRRRGLSGPLGTTDVAINHYRVPPGERVSGLHAHGDQEEVFLVVDGTITVETYDGEVGREVTVAAGEAVRFAPGEYQSVKNTGDAPATLYALGAPPDSEDVRIPLACPDCGTDHVEPTLGSEGEAVLACPNCGSESVVACPDCGGDRLHARLGESGRPVSACRDCGYASPTL